MEDPLTPKPSRAADASAALTRPSDELRERRPQVIAALSLAFSRGELEVDELERRLELVHQAATERELELASPTALVAAPAQAALTFSARPVRQTLTAVMGGVHRAGPWTVPSKLKLFCVMGGVSLDLRDADLAPGETELSITCLMGGVEIIAPPHVRVELAGSAILGGFEQAHPGADALSVEQTAIVRITGVAIAGGVSVETRRAGESARQARKRIKGESARLLEDGQRGRAALPTAIAVSDRKGK
ncbi:MAG: LiaF-related protein [Kofleriaceae bacterium]